MRLGVCVLLAACAGPSLAYERELVRGPYGSPPEQPGVIEAMGTCRRKLRVRVIDTTHAPVQGAHVSVHRRVSVHAIEENLATYDYRTSPAVTDKHGFARVCAPDDMPPRSPWEGVGGGFTMGGVGDIFVSYRGRARSIAARDNASIMLPAQ